MFILMQCAFVQTNLVSEILVMFQWTYYEMASEMATAKTFKHRK